MPFSPIKSIPIKSQQSQSQGDGIVFTESKGFTNIPGLSRVEGAKTLAKNQAELSFERSVGSDLFKRISQKSLSTKKPVLQFTIEDIYDVTGGNENEIKSIQSAIGQQIKNQRDLTSSQQDLKAKNFASEIGRIANETNPLDVTSDLNVFFIAEKTGDFEGAKKVLSAIQEDPNFKSLTADSAKGLGISVQAVKTLNSLEKKIKDNNLLISPQVFDRTTNAELISLADLLSKKRTGAAPNSLETENYKKLLPSFLDSKETKQFKIDQLREEFKTFGELLSSRKRFNSLLDSITPKTDAQDQSIEQKSVAPQVPQSIKTDSISGAPPQGSLRLPLDKKRQFLKTVSPSITDNELSSLGEDQVDDAVNLSLKTNYDPTPFLRSFLSGRTAGLSDLAIKGAKFAKEKISGSDDSFQEVSKEDEDSKEENLAASILGAVSPGSVPSMVMSKIFKVANAIPAMKSSGSIGSIVGEKIFDIAKATGAGTISGSILSSVNELNNAVAGDADMSRVVKAGLISGALTGGLSTASTGLGVVSDVAKLLSKKGRETEIYGKVVNAFRKQVAQTGKDSLSKEEVAKNFLDSMKNFSSESESKFDKAVKPFLTESKASLGNMFNSVSSMLDEAGLVAKKNGKFILTPPTKNNPFYSFKLTPQGQAGVPVRHLSKEAQSTLLKEFKGAQASGTIKGLQDAKQRVGEDIGQFKRGEDVALKRVYGALKKDIVDTIGKTHGEDAKKIVEAAYKSAANDIKATEALNKTLGIKEGAAPELSDVHRKLFSFFKSRSSVLDKFKAVVGKSTMESMASSVKGDLIKKGMTQEGGFRPNTFLINLKQFGFGTNDDVLKKFLSGKDYSDLKRLENLSKVAMNKYKINAVPLESSDIATTSEKFFSQVGGGIPSGASLSKAQVLNQLSRLLFNVLKNEKKAISSISTSASKLGKKIGSSGKFIPGVVSTTFKEKNL